MWKIVTLRNLGHEIIFLKNPDFVFRIVSKNKYQIFLKLSYLQIVIKRLYVLKYIRLVSE